MRRMGLEKLDHPQTYGIGVKELWEVPEGRFAKGHVVHTMGYPLPANIYGGGVSPCLGGRTGSLSLFFGLATPGPPPPRPGRPPPPQQHPPLPRALARRDTLR